MMNLGSSSANPAGGSKRPSPLRPLPVVGFDHPDVVSVPSVEVRADLSDARLA